MAIIVAGVGFVFACNKSNSTNPNSTTTSSQLQTQADDQAMVSNESDAVSDDANTSLYSSASVAGSSINPSSGSGTITTLGVKQVDTAGGYGTINRNLICDASVVINDSEGVRTITITYDGSNCSGNRTRTGVVVVTLPIGKYWKDAGATVSISIQNLKITRVRDNKSIVINGTKTMTNVSGGTLADLATEGAITHTVTGSLTITFDDGSQRAWNVSKQRVFSYNDGIVITTSGTHADSLSNNDVAEWGVNRYGTSFESLISAAKVFLQSCDYQLTAGQNTILRSDGITSVITYGLDVNGEPTGCPGTGTYYYKLVYTLASGKTYTYILPY